MEKRDYQDNNEKISVLILSDRLSKQAKALAEYLRGTDTVHVVGLAEDRQQALGIAKEHTFEYLVIAGYLKAERTYEVIAELKGQQKKFIAVQWAMLDSLITGFCQRYKIPLKFERTKPMGDFVAFLEAHRNDPIY
jgi:ActR/RegA family two-component response regulator